MARCKECNKYVGCMCNLSDNKLCNSCEAKLVEKRAEQELSKIDIKFNLPDANS